MSTFEQFFDIFDELDKLLEDGPLVAADDSIEAEAFLAAIREHLNRLNGITLTVADVEEEFTEDDDDKEKDDDKDREEVSAFEFD